MKIQEQLGIDIETETVVNHVVQLTLPSDLSVMQLPQSGTISPLTFTLPIHS